jgi:hypothetical protein
MSRRWSGREEEASSQQIEAGTAKHLALEHLQAIDVPFDWSLTPRQRDSGLDGGHVRPEPSGEMPEGWEGALGGAHQAWFQARKLALADEGGEVLGQRHRLCQCGRLQSQLCQLVVIPCRRPLRWAKDEPGGPPRREEAPWRHRHCRQRLIAPALPGR